MMQALIKYQATGNPHPDGLLSFATVIQSPSQKELLLGLLDTKGTPANSDDGESEILLADPVWNKSIIINQYGVVSDGFRLYKNQQELFQGLFQRKIEATGFHEYKLSPSAFSKLHGLIETLFSQQPLTTPVKVAPLKSLPASVNKPSP